VQTSVCVWQDGVVGSPRDRQISIVLSPTQVEEVLRAAGRSRAPAMRALIARSRDARPGPARARGRGVGARADGPGMPLDTNDPRLSRSLLRGLSILTRFGEARERGIVEIAAELGMSPSTAHRYAQTLIELGLLERCPRSRKYRLPLV
jgi:hypothetical protein